MSQVDIERLLEEHKAHQQASGGDPLQDALKDQLGEADTPKPMALNRKDIDTFLAIAKATPEAPPADKRQRRVVAELLGKATEQDLHKLRIKLKKHDIHFKKMLKTWAKGKAPRDDKAVYVDTYHRVQRPSLELEGQDEPSSQAESAAESEGPTELQVAKRKLREFHALTELQKTETDPAKVDAIRKRRTALYLELQKYKAKRK